MKKFFLVCLTIAAAGPIAWTQDPPQLPDNTRILAPPRVIITVVRPEKYEQVLRGEQQTIQWAKIGDIGRPTIEIKKGDAVVRTYSLVAPEGPIAGKWRWTWEVPAALAPGNDYRVRVISENGRVSDHGPYFSVVTSKIEIYMPRAGSHYDRGSTMTIHFRCFNVTQNVRVYPLNFANYPIAVNIRPDTGYVDWRSAGTSPDGEVIMPDSGRIVVTTMDGSVYAESQVYQIDD
jgi:hypothetical protein